MSATPLRPPMPYYGGKQTVAPRIVELLPPHQHYVEPYAGSLSVLLAKPASRMETVNDLDGELVGFWRTLRERPEDLIRACALTPHARAEHLAAWDADPAADEVERARRTWVKLTQGRSGSLRRVRTGWRFFVSPRGSSIGMPGYLSGYVARMAPLVERLHQVTLECRPALDIVEQYGQHAETLLYVDPPYLGCTRSHGDQYRHEMRDEASHRALAAALRACRAIVVLSGYGSDLYDRELYPDWHRVALPAATGNGGEARGRTEVLWANVQLGKQLELFAAGAS